jgi:hypothetical protein
MPDTTANGYPYAVPSDPLVQWPATSQSLAEKLEALPKILGATDIMFGITDVALGSSQTNAAEGQFGIDLGRLGARFALMQYTGNYAANLNRCAFIATAGTVIVGKAWQWNGTTWVPGAYNDYVERVAYLAVF